MIDVAKPASSELEVELRRHLRFDGSDLEANRQGKLSARQIRRMYIRAVIWGLTGLSCAGLAFAVLASRSFSGNDVQVGSLAILAGAAIWAVMNARRRVDDARHATANSWSGALTCGRERKRLSEGSSSPTYDFDYYITGKGARWSIPYRTYRIFQNGQYRVFYATDSEALLSMEPLFAPSELRQRRSTSPVEMPGSFLPMLGLSFLVFIGLFVGISGQYVPLIVVMLGALMVVGLYLMLIVPFALAMPIVLGAAFFAVMVSAVGLATPR